MTKGRQFLPLLCKCLCFGVILRPAGLEGRGSQTLTIATETLMNDSVTLLQALSSMLAGRDEGVPLDMLPDVAACLLECLARHCSSNAALPLDRPSSRYFHTLLRTLQAAVSQVRHWHHPSVVRYIYGVSPSLITLPDQSPSMTGRPFMQSARQ